MYEKCALFIKYMYEKYAFFVNYMCQKYVILLIFLLKASILNIGEVLWRENFIKF